MVLKNTLTTKQVSSRSNIIPVGMGTSPILKDRKLETILSAAKPSICMVSRRPSPSIQPILRLEKGSDSQSMLKNATMEKPV